MTIEADTERRNALKDALEKCAETVNRTLLSVLAVALFCFFTIFGATDRSLLAAEPSIKVPFAEAPISLVGFLIAAPLLVCALTIYLHIFYGHWIGLDAERRAQGLIDTYPTLFNIDHWVARLLTMFCFYWLAPLVLVTITRKAAGRFAWGLPLGVVTVCVIGGFAFMIVRRHAPGGKQKQHAAALCLAGLAALIGPMLCDIFSHGRDPRHTASWERPLNLFRADLKGAWLPGRSLVDANLYEANLEDVSLIRADLTGANLAKANLAKANLTEANLTQAHLAAANLTQAHLELANFTRAHLTAANLTQAHLTGAHLTQADLTGANLTEADLGAADLTQAHLDSTNLKGANLEDVQGLTCDQVLSARTDTATKLPPGMDCPKK